MEINIKAKEKLRIATGEELSLVVESAINKEALIVGFYRSQKQQLRKKENAYIMFVFEKEQSIEEFDFGYYSDAEVVWQNF